MMKKTAVLFMLLFTLLITSVLSGCGSGPNTDSAGAPDSAVSAADQGSPDGNASASGQSSPGGTPIETDSSKIPDTNESAVSDWGVAPAPESNTAVALGNSGPAASESSSGAEDGNTGAAADIGQIIVDRDDLYLAIKKVDAGSSLGYTWKMYIENRTDKNLMFSFEKVSVNGVMCDPFWAELIAAGKKGNCEIIWMRDSLEERQISEVTQVDFTLNVYNDDDYTEAPLMRDPFTVYPLGEDRKADGPALREPADTDIVLVDNDDCAIIVTGYDPDNSWGYAVNLYLQNKMEKDLIFSTENSSVNGFMCEPFWAEIVTAGNSAYSTILWDTSALSENGITEVKEISLPMRVYSDNDVVNPYIEETFELTP